MYGQGLAKGLWVTLKHFVNTYIADVARGSRDYLGDTQFEMRQGPKAKGIFTVEYPDEKLRTTIIQNVPVIPGVQAVASARRYARRSVSGLCAAMIRCQAARFQSHRHSISTSTSA
jgi:hypothetical protein